MSPGNGKRPQGTEGPAGCAAPNGAAWWVGVLGALLWGVCWLLKRIGFPGLGRNKVPHTTWPKTTICVLKNKVYCLTDPKVEEVRMSVEPASVQRLLGGIITFCGSPGPRVPLGLWPPGSALCPHLRSLLWVFASSREDTLSSDLGPTQIIQYDLILRSLT